MRKYIFLLITTLLFCFPTFATFSIKIESDDIVKLGDMAKFTVTVANHGELVGNITLRVQIPEGFKYKERPTGNFQFLWKIGSMQTNEERHFPYELETLKCGDFMCIAVVSAGELSVEGRKKVKVASPDLTVRMDSNAKVAFFNKPIILTNTIRNNGNWEAKNVKVVLTIPRELEYVSSEPAGVYKYPKENKNVEITWFIDKISPKQLITLFCTIQAIDCCPRCTNYIRVHAEDSVVEDDFSIRVQCCSAPHLFTYDTEKSIEVGSETTYVVTCCNEGTSTITNIQCKSKIPEKMQFILARSPVGFTYDSQSRTVIFDSFPALSPGGKLIFRVTCKAMKPGLATHMAYFKYDQSKEELTDEEETNIYE